MEFCIIATGIVLANGMSIYHKHRYLVETTRPTLVMSSNDNEPALLVVELLAMNDNKKLSNFIEIDAKVQVTCIKELDIYQVAQGLPNCLLNDTNSYNYIINNGRAGLWCYLFKY